MNRSLKRTIRREMLVLRTATYLWLSLLVAWVALT